MKNTFLIFSLLLTLNTQLTAQRDSLKQVIEKVFYHKRVSTRIFFEYQGIGEKPHVLSDGEYAFIYPNSIFQKFDPEILDRLANTWGSERKLYTVTYIKKPIGSVFIKSNVNSDPNLKFYILFQRITFLGKKAYLSFTTSCRREDADKGTVTFFEADLRAKRNKWKITRLIIREEKNCK
jgi:hypothetical protein